MIIDIFNMNIDIGEFYVFETGGIKVFYKGIFVFNGLKEGFESIEALCEHLINFDEIDFLNCFGAYHLIICYDNKIIAFTDNSIQRCFFYSGSHLSNSFLEVLKRKKKVTIDKKYLIEYLFFDTISDGHTYFKEINVISSSMYAVIENGEIRFHKKFSKTLNDSKLAISDKTMSRILKYSISCSKKFLSLTGGFDSRFVLALFNKSENLVTGISGNNRHDKDASISAKVAETDGVEYRFIDIDKPEVNDKLINNILYSRDCFFSFLGKETINMTMYLKILKDMGFQYLFTGDSGVFYKAEQFRFDFPFYNRKTTSYKKYFHFLYEPNYNMEYYPSEVQNAIKHIKNKKLRLMKENKQSINTKSYDWYEWYIMRSNKVPPYYNSKSNILETYAPLYEFRYIINYYNLPRNLRRFGNQMRNVISDYNSSVSKIRTYHGSTTSKKTIYKITDCVAYVGELSSSLFRFLAKKLFKKSILNSNIINWEIDKELRQTDIAHKAYRFAKKNNIINGDVEIESIPIDILGKLIEVYYALDTRRI